MADEEDDKDASRDDEEEDSSDVRALRITREMGRAVIDQQIENINGLNDKAAQTIRFNVLILGVVLTVFSLAFNGSSDSQVQRLMNGAVGAGVLLSATSILAALWAYTSSEKEVGPTGSAMEQVISDATGHSERHWLRSVIRSQSNWITKNERVNREDAVFLFLSHLYLFVSIGVYAFGVAWGFSWWHLPEYYYWASVAFLAVILPSLVLLPGRLNGRLPNQIEQIVNRATMALMEAM